MRGNQLPVYALCGTMVPRNALHLLYNEKPKNVKNSTTPKARGKNKHRFGIHKILEIFVVCLTKFKNINILLNKISHRFLQDTKLFTR
jgi:hypothetical protein